MSQEFIKTELAKYNLPDAAIAKMKADYLPLKVESVEDVENYMICKEKHKEVKDIRIAIENKRKDLKASSLEFGRAVDGEAKRLTSGVKEIEDHLLVQRAVVEDEKKRLAEEVALKEKEEEERIRLEEEARIEKVRQEQEAKEKELREREEKIEGERLANEAEALRLKEAAERQEREVKEAEEAKKRAEQDEKDRVEREKRHAEEVKNAEKEAAERAIREREEAEEAIKVTAEKKKLLAPDKEKIESFAKDIDNLSVPQVKTKEAQAILVAANNLIVEVIEFLEKEAGKL